MAQQNHLFWPHDNICTAPAHLNISLELIFYWATDRHSNYAAIWNPWLLTEMDLAGSAMIHAIEFPPIASGRRITFATVRFFHTSSKATAKHGLRFRAFFTMSCCSYDQHWGLLRSLCVKYNYLWTVNMFFPVKDHQDKYKSIQLMYNIICIITFIRMS